jgi:uncharacterized tellurite resistance protein B-like protein
VRLLDRLREHLERRASLATDRSGAPADLELQAAAAILLLEAAHGDGEYLWHEHRAILKGLERSFGIGRSETLRILERAEEIRPPIVHLADVTELIKERYDVERRKDLVALLWSAVEADESVEEWEQVFADHVARAVGLTSEQAQEARSRGRS